MDSILISIIVPIYNIEQYISKCINSIICQTYSNIEIILVDDGSTDTSGLICDEFAKFDSRIKVIHKINEGLVRARKSGLSIAKGEYIGFVDGDDYIEPEMYEKLYQEISLNNADMVHMGYESLGVSFLPYMDEEVIINERNRTSLLEKYVLGTKENTIIAPSVCVKLFSAELIKKCYEQVPDECSYGEDFICFNYCFLECKKIVLRRQSYYHYVIRNDSIMHTNLVDRICKECGLYKVLEKALKENDLWSSLAEKIKDYFAKVIWDLTKEMNKESIHMQNYIFPNVEYLKGKNIIIYGAGKVGRDYYSQICRYSECNIVLWIDKNYNNYDFPFFEVKEVSNIKQYDFDIIVIAVRNRKLAIEIMMELEKNGVAKQKIIWEEPRVVL